MGGWKMKSMAIRTRERHVKGQEWERKEKQQPPVLCKEDTQRAWGERVAPSPLCILFPALHQPCPVRKRLPRPGPEEEIDGG